jgi:hypothetical protein
MQLSDSYESHAPGTHPKVFVSYTHDDESHRDAVLAFATFLTGQGIDVVLDRWTSGQRQDWQAWATAAMTDSDYVVVVASPGYRRMGDGNGPNDRNLGGQSEAALLRDLLQGDRRTWTEKILPVLLPGHGIGEIPLFLQPHAADRYAVESLTVSGAEDLIRVLTRQPLHVRPELGRPPVLPPRSGPGASTQEPGWTILPEALPVAWRPQMVPGNPQPQGSTVELHLVPVGAMRRLGVRQLEALREELAHVGRSGKLFSSAERLVIGSSDQAAWAYSTDWRSGEAGLAAHRDGQRSCWFPLPRGEIGSILDEDDLVERLADRLTLLTELEIPLPEGVSPAIGLDPVGMVRLGRLSEASARSASFPMSPQDQIHVGADESLPLDAFKRSVRSVADELTARLAAAIRR